MTTVTVLALVLRMERVINCNLARLGRLLRILRFNARDLNLKPSMTASLLGRIEAAFAVHQDADDKINKATPAMVSNSSSKFQ